MRNEAFKKSILIMIPLLMLSLAHVALSAGTSAGQTVDDSAITTKVKSKMMAEKGLPASNIHVETNNGDVLLSGHVDTGAEKNRAAEIARSVDGVRKVQNDIKSPACPIGANWPC